MQAGAAFVPFTIILGATINGTRAPKRSSSPPDQRESGPSIVAPGFVLLALRGTGGGYWTTFFAPMAVVGFGMAVNVGTTDDDRDEC
jgi:hypothetical protein